MSSQIYEKNPTKVKTYGFWIRYQSRSGFHNSYKEFRDLTMNGAVEQLYQRRRRSCLSYRLVRTRIFFH